MSRENVLRVADAIEQHSIPDLGFNMSGYFQAGNGEHTAGFLFVGSWLQ